MPQTREQLPASGRASLPADAYWYLVGFVDRHQKQWRTVIRSLPLRVGRHSSADLYLYSTSVSHLHAEFFQQDSSLWLRDLDSTNGTYVNSTKLTRPVQLEEGDTIHFADLTFRIGVYTPPIDTNPAHTHELKTEELAGRLHEYTGEFTRFMDKADLRPYFQGVFGLNNGLDVLGYELLSRGLFGGLETLPLELFYIAERLGRERELSQLCRQVGASAAGRLPGNPLCFMNTHPAEIGRPQELLGSLEQLREQAPDIRLAIEIHEAAVTDYQAVAELRSGLRQLEIELAYDDFGTGRSRLAEIAEVPPDYLKFDMSLIRDLDAASDERLQFVAGLVETARSIGIVSIAEGIETEKEADACRKAGFKHAQGYYLALPRPVEETAAESSSD